MSSPQLTRVIGKWSLAALAINSVVGSSIFGLPPRIAGLVGKWSPAAVLVAGLLMAILMACFAEVASYFTEAGGPYLYGRVAFGAFIGIVTGWMFWLAQLTASAANANLFVTYLGEFWPGAASPIGRLTILTGLIGFLALLNYRGVRAGIRASNVLTITKVGALVAVILTGVVYVMRAHLPLPVLQSEGRGGWVRALQVLIFFYGGFETALTPMGEARNPRRDAAFALTAALLACMTIYVMIQWLVISILPDPVASQRPLAELAGISVGPAGDVLVAVAALVTLYGYLSAKILAVPRITFALSEQGDFPRPFSAVHPRFRTPYISILVFAGLTWLLAIFGTFAWNVTLSAVARLFYYGVCCAALIRLRRLRPGQALVRVPAGTLLAIAGIIICIVLFAAVERANEEIVGFTVLCALANWWWVRTRKPAF